MMWRELRGGAYAAHGRSVTPRPPVCVHTGDPSTSTVAYVYINPGRLHYIYTHIYSVFPTRSNTHPPVDRLRNRVPIRARTHARIGGAAAHNGRAASKTRRAHPSRWLATGRRAAHTLQISLTRAVFHAPMFALNAIASENACEPSRKRSTPTGRARTLGADACIYRET